MTHLSFEQLEAFVLGTLDPAGTRALAQHVRDCPACARRLHAEAAFEVLLRDVANAAPASAPSVARASPRRRRRAVAGGLALALAAGAALLVWRGEPSRPSPALEQEAVTVSSRGVRCAHGPAQADCLRRAQRRGLFVAYPPPVHTRYGLEEL